MIIEKSFYGLPLASRICKTKLSEEIMELIRKREAARKVGDFKTADQIRTGLREEYNIVLEDTEDGVKWKKLK